MADWDSASWLSFSEAHLRGLEKDSFAPEIEKSGKKDRKKPATYRTKIPILPKSRSLFLCHQNMKYWQVKWFLCLCESVNKAMVWTFFEVEFCEKGFKLLILYLSSIGL